MASIAWLKPKGKPSMTKTGTGNWKRTGNGWLTGNSSQVDQGGSVFLIQTYNDGSVQFSLHCKNGRVNLPLYNCAPVTLLVQGFIQQFMSS